MSQKPTVLKTCDYLSTYQQHLNAKIIWVSHRFTHMCRHNFLPSKTRLLIHIIREKISTYKHMYLINQSYMA